MKSIALKIWLTITLINLGIFLMLGIVLGTLVHDFHFDLKAEDLKALGHEINDIYKTSGKQEVLNYSLAMSKHMLSKIAIIDNSGKIILNTDQKLFQDNFTIEKIRNLKEKKYYVNVFNNNLLLVIVPDRSNKFSTIIFTPVAPITSTINQIWLYILYTGIGVMILMALISYLISRRISAPLLNLNKEALKIAEGEFDKLNVPVTKDEIGQLSGTILYVAKAMKQTLADREKLNQIQKDFLANVSHDLRTPLSLIKGYAIALQQEVVEDNEKDEAIKIIIEESDRMDRLTNELLELAKLEAGKEKLQLSSISLAEVTQSIIKSYSATFSSKNIVINFKDESHHNKVLANEDRIRQAIINLLINAYNHTPPEGTITINIKLENRHLLLAIHNTGPHINTEDIKYIWERFYKADKSRTPHNAKGSGLGLPIVKGIITAHGGSVGVDSSEIDGTSFWITLPIR